MLLLSLSCTCFICAWSEACPDGRVALKCRLLLGPFCLYYCCCKWNTGNFCCYKYSTVLLNLGGLRYPAPNALPRASLDTSHVAHGGVDDRIHVVRMSGKPATESAAMESEDSAERSVLGARRTCSHGTWPLAIRKPAESAWRPSAGTVLSMARKSQSIAEALCRVRRP